MTDPNKNIEKDIDRFDDVFHNYEDDVDEDKDEYVDFDNYYQNFHMHNDDDDTILASLLQCEDDQRDLRTDLVIEQQQQQQIAQGSSHIVALVSEKEMPQEVNEVVHAESEQSTTTTTVKKRPSLTPPTPTTDMPPKKIKPLHIDDKTDGGLPRFLSRTNDIFQAAMKPSLDKGATSSINIEQLRHIALLKFYIAINDLDISLWTTYLQSGTGKLQQSKEEQVTTTTTKYPTLKRWPSDVKNKIIESGFQIKDNKKIDDDTYLSYVYKKLRQFRDKNKQYYNELKEEKQRLINSFTLELEDTIDKFVEQHGTTFHRVPVDGQISTVEYKYNDRLLELEFYEQNPRVHQVEVFQNISKLKYDKEIAKMSVAILKQRLLYNHLPSSFESLHIPEPISLNTIQTDAIRQRLSERYHKVLQRTKSDMLHVYIATEQAKADERIKEFDQDYNEMKEKQRVGPIHNKLTPTMLSLLQKRLQNINTHIMLMYNLKIRFFAKAPTDKN